MCPRIASDDGVWELLPEEDEEEVVEDEDEGVENSVATINERRLRKTRTAKFPDMVLWLEVSC